MNNFLFKQIKFLSGTTALLLCWQSLAIANPSLNKKLTIKKPPQWIAQLQTQNQDVLVPNPVIEIDGKPVDSNKIMISAPQFLPRAVAPPVGDMSVSNINTRINSPINLGNQGSALIPRLVLREAPANEVLALLARAANYNIIFTDQNQQQQGGQEQQENPFVSITLDIENEPIQDIFNSILMLSNLQASQQGRTIMVGRRLPSGARQLITRTIRLNQATPEAAANFLATQGAEVSIVFTPVTREFNPETGAVLREVVEPTRLVPVTVQGEEGRSALPLTGLQVSTDDRTGAVTLVGEPNLVQMASSFLTQLDLRRRQVAVNVKVIDVQLDQQDSFGASFSFGIDNTGVIQDGGVGVINFGTNNQNVDPQQWRTSGVGNPDLAIQGYIDNELVDPYNQQIQITEGFSRNLANDLTNTLSQSTNTNLSDQLSRNFADTINRTLSQFGNTSSFTRDQVETLQRALTDNLTRTASETLGSSNTENITDSIIRNVSRSLQGLPLAAPNAGQISPFGVNVDQENIAGSSATIRPGRNFNVPQAFLAQIRANITSGNAKILTDPTLVVQEGQIGAVKLVENVVTSVESEVDPDNGVRTTTPVLEPAGLTLSVNVEKIDDNGFISLRVDPTISAPGSPQNFESGPGAVNIITPLIERSVSSGLIRLRDGQTLILSGIIQDGERTQVSKVPILGDLPLIGSLFRSTFKDKTRSEVVVILTPQILDDSDASSGFGYNYTPSRETGKYLQERGLNIPTTPY